MVAIERLTDITTELGESPFWSVEEQALYWIDWQTMRVLRMDWTTGKVAHWAIGERIGCLVGRRGGGVILALAASFCAFDPASGERRPLATPDLTPATELNDGKCDGLGRFWCGSMASDGAQPLGRMWRLAADGTTMALGPAMTMVNGVCWSPDDTLLYVGDSGARTIYEADFDLAAGTFDRLRPLATVEPPGVPDGATVDAEGFIWWTEFDNGRIRRYAPDGRVDRTIDLPVSQPTSCIFGGPNLDRLIVTTGRYDFDAAARSDQPLAGALLALDVGVTGLPEPTYPEPGPTR